MTDGDALIKELKKSIEQAERYGLYPYVTTGRLKSLVNKYEIQTVNAVDDQPGEWSIRGGNVEALQHSGNMESATKVQNWIISRGGKARILKEPELPGVYIQVDSPRSPDIIGPGWWVVRTADGIFFAVSESDFHIIYVPREAA